MVWKWFMAVLGGSAAVRARAWDLCSPGLQHPKHEVKNRMKEPPQIIAAYSCLGRFPHLHCRLGYMVNGWKWVLGLIHIPQIFAGFFHVQGPQKPAALWIPSNPIQHLLKGGKPDSWRISKMSSLFRCFIIA